MSDCELLVREAGDYPDLTEPESPTTDIQKYSDDQPREDDGRFASAESYAGKLSERINAAAARGDLLTVVKLMKEARDRGLDIRVGVPNDHAEMRAQAAGKTVWISKTAFFTDEEGVVHPIRGSDGYEDRPSEGKERGSSASAGPKEKPSAEEPQIPKEYRSPGEANAALKAILPEASHVRLVRDDFKQGSNINTKVAADVIKTIVDLKRDFPVATAGLNGVATATPGTGGRNAIAWYSDGAKNIIMGSRFSGASGDKKLTDMYKLGRLTGFYAKVGDEHSGARYFFTHEFGHHLDHYVSEHLGKVAGAAREKGDAKKGAAVERAWKNYRAAKSSLPPASTYAKTNGFERVAEGFAGGYLNPSEHPEAVKMIDTMKAAFRLKP